MILLTYIHTGHKPDAAHSVAAAPAALYCKNYVVVVVVYYVHTYVSLLDRAF